MSDMYICRKCRIPCACMFPGDNKPDACLQLTTKGNGIPAEWEQIA